MMNEMTSPNRSKRSFIEVLIIFVIMIVLMAIDKNLSVVAGIIPIVYFFVDIRLRNRKAAGPEALLSGIKKSWYWIVIVVFGLQTFDYVIFDNFFPEMMEHLKARAPMLEQGFDISLLLTFLIAAFGEEVAFRGLLQERLSWYAKPYIAIPLTSVIFALMHLSHGSVQIVSLDLASVFVDSLVFGVIYYKTRNIWVSWLAHFAANLVAYFYIVNGLW
ncbi:CPBP family intramembrane glutamic endopeptidase [Paenibacillus xylaniclasticus]|uniref:CPBP family intramembrane glutamic endopeptidase n=1 Tax=Paenibacillus xylaniclasticus TaxID=588083 RepID=UPI000FD82E04|nr:MULTISPECIES: CPBP family intramembrane glutamic endopeptidase [Paenibacillus]GFN31381.1 hypothetical protein PCURB6_16410 [Paenibacillus curdlanolyticus]